MGCGGRTEEHIMKTFLTHLIKAHVSGIAATLAIGAAAFSVTGCSSDAGSENAASSSSDAVCATGGTLEGIDVSEFQATIDWNAVKASGRTFAIARVADGIQHVDPTFPENWAGIRAAGMVRGVYQFYRASQDGTAQANLLLDHVGALGAGDLPPVLDVEVSDGAGAGQILAGIRAWTARIQQATGRKPIIYTAPGFWDGLGAGHDFEAADTLWVADWFVSCPVPASSWGNWKMWQYVDNGSVPGISGRVDLDRFAGSLADLNALTNLDVIKIWLAHNEADDGHQYIMNGGLNHRTKGKGHDQPNSDIQHIAFECEITKLS